MIAEHSDETLMLNYCHGDLLAFKELYRRHSVGLYRFIAWRSPRKEWIDEIAQDSWAALHAARARYEPVAKFRTFLYQIARNRLIDLVRQKQSQFTGELDAEGGNDTACNQVDDGTQDHASPETMLSKKQQIATLHAAISVLPNDQKEAIVLQQFSGMSLDEIAKVTEVPLETVKSRIRYAMKKLRTQLQDLVTQGELT